MDRPGRPLIVGNWKMNGVAADLAQVRLLGRALSDHPAWAEVVVCPPATLLALAGRALEDAAATGGQTCHPESRGAHTGEVSAPMLADAGARYVIVGHSERRSRQGETDLTTAARARAAAAAGLVPIVCVGETLAQRRAGRTADALRRQVARSCPAELRGALVVAYEPVWAIGSGLTPAPSEIAQAHAVIRSALGGRPGPAAAARTRILYGGSVDGANAGAILQVPGVDGLLVGRAALAPETFLPVIRAADALAPPVRAIA